MNACTPTWRPGPLRNLKLRHCKGSICAILEHNVAVVLTTQIFQPKTLHAALVLTMKRRTGDGRTIINTARIEVPFMWGSLRLAPII